MFRTFLVLALLGTLASAASTILILDASGSMDDTVASGQRKIDVAKEAGNTFLDNVRPGDEVALIVFYDCGDIETTVPFTTDMQSVKGAMADVEPYSNTPIADSIVYASDYAQSSGRGGAQVILLTDGEETCKTQDDAINAASSATTGGGIKIINVVGLGIDQSSTAYTDLQAISAAGKGKYYEANDVGTLTSSLTQAYNDTGAGCCVPTALLPGIVVAAFVYSRKN